MDEDQDLDNQSYDDPNESPVIKDLRARERAAQKAAKEATKRADEAEAKIQSLRDEAAQTIVDALGIPGLKEDVLRWVEGPITSEGVAEALKARGIPVTGAESQPNEPAEEPAPIPATPNPSKIGQEVARVAAGGAVKDLPTSIMDAESRSAIAEVMGNAGLVRDHRPT